MELAGHCVVTAYDDVVAALADTRLTEDRMHRFAERSPPDVVDAVRRHAVWLISPEGADYDWLRPLLHAGLRSAIGSDSDRAIAAAAGELLDDLLERERFDVVGDYALALSGRVLADLLGVDPRDGVRLIDWAQDLVAFFNDFDVDVATADRMARSAAQMAAYAQELVANRRGQLHQGLLEMVARAAAERDHALDDEGLAQLTLPFLSGEVGVAQLVANCVWLLLVHPDQRERLSADPGLLAGAIGEALRCLPPASVAQRIALERVVVGGQVVEPGQIVLLDLAAANRDPGLFPDPDRFDIARRHGGALGFGHGPHSCVGARLARMQTATALEALLRRAPDLELDRDFGVAWSPLAGLRAPDALYVRPN
jgi:cytochrome P450